MKNFDFIAKRKVFCIVSAALLVVGLIFNLILGVKMDIEFTGGTLLRYSYEGNLDASAVESFVLTKLPEAEVSVSESGVAGIKTITVTLTKDIDVETQTTFVDVLSKQYPDNKITALETSSPQASYGRAFFLKCVVAVALASFLVVVFVGFRFRHIGGFSAGVMSLLALLHDVLLAYFTFVIFRIPLNDNFMAVVLTILGYSLNDTIVIFDRIRENRKKMEHNTPISSIVNLSLQQSFGRTLNTSICTLIAIGAVAVIALVNSMNDIVSFALPMSIGVICGFYSSTFLCTPLWALWMEKSAGKKKTKKPAKKKA